MDLQRNAVIILLVLLTGLELPITANSGMSGSDQNGGSISGETSTSISIDSSGGFSPEGSHSGDYLGSYPYLYPYQGPRTSFSSGKRSNSFANGYQVPNQYKTPFLGVLLTEVTTGLQSDSYRLQKVGTGLNALKQTEKIGSDKWKKLDELQNEINGVQKDLQQNIDNIRGWDTTSEP